MQTSMPSEVGTKLLNFVIRPGLICEHEAWKVGTLWALAQTHDGGLCTASHDGAQCLVE